MLSTIGAFQEKVTKILVERLVQNWFEGDVDVSTANGSQIILKNITLKEISLHDYQLAIGGGCQRAVLEIDWSGLWRYWQVNSAPCKHILRLQQCSLTIGELHNTGNNDDNDNDDEEFHDAIPWNSLEELEMEFHACHAQQQEQQKVSLFGDWIDGLIGQFQLEIEGLSLEKNGHEFEGTVSNLTIHAVQDGRRMIGLTECAFRKAGSLIAATGQIDGQMEGNQRNSIELHCRDLSFAYGKYCGVVNDLKASRHEVSVASIVVENLVSVAGLRYVPASKRLSADRISSNVAFGPAAEDNYPYTTTTALPLDSIPDFCKLIQVSVSSFSSQDVEVSSLEGIWPQFKIAAASGKHFRSQGITIDLNDDVSEATAKLFICDDQKRFIDNIQVDVIDDDTVGTANVRVTISTLSLSMLDFFDFSPEAAPSESGLKLPFSLQVNVLNAEVSSGNDDDDGDGCFTGKLTDCSITALTDNSIKATIGSLSVYSQHHRIQTAAVKAVKIENSLTVAVDGLSMESFIESTESAPQSTLVEQWLSLLRMEISSVHLKNSHFQLTHQRLLQHPITAGTSSVFCFPSRRVAYIEDLQARDSTGALVLKTGAIRVSYAGVECDELDCDIVDIEQAREFLQSLQDLINPPVPVTEPSVKWWYQLAQDEGEDEKEQIMDEDEDEKEQILDEDKKEQIMDEEALMEASETESSKGLDEGDDGDDCNLDGSGFSVGSSAEPCANNLDMEALKDALESSLLPESSEAPEDRDTFAIDIRAVRIASAPFRLTCSVRVVLGSSGSGHHVILNALTLTHAHKQFPVVVKWPRGPLKDSTAFGSSSFSDVTIHVSRKADDGEYVMDVRVCPLRIKLDSGILSDVLSVTTRMAASTAQTAAAAVAPGTESAGSIALVTPVAFFAVVKLTPIAIKLDFQPTLQGAHLLLPGATLTGIPGLAGLCSALYRLWLPSLNSRAQVNRMLRSGLAPVRMSVRLSQGVVELILLPGSVLKSQQSPARIADDARRAAKMVAAEVIRGTAGVVGKLVLVVCSGSTAGADADSSCTSGGGESVAAMRPVAIISEGLQLLLTELE